MRPEKTVSISDFIEELHRYTESLGVYLALDPSTFRIIGVTGLTASSRDTLIDTLELLLYEVDAEMDGEVSSDADIVLLLLDTYVQQIKSLPEDRLNIVH